MNDNFHFISKKQTIEKMLKKSKIDLQTNNSKKLYFQLSEKSLLQELLSLKSFLVPKKQKNVIIDFKHLILLYITLRLAWKQFNPIFFSFAPKCKKNKRKKALFSNWRKKLLKVRLKGSNTHIGRVLCLFQISLNKVKVRRPPQEQYPCGQGSLQGLEIFIG